MHHFHRWGLEVHSGNPSKKSKTEILFASARPQLYQNPDTFDNCDLSPIMVGDGNFLPVVAVFQYLGSMLARNSQDNEDVKSRIDLAAAAFGSLRDCLFSSPRICLEAKTIVFEGLILSILLYGAECWSLTEECMRKIRVFISRCIRNMFRVTRKQTREYHISNEEFRNRAGLLTADAYVMRHQLRWARHVSRMDWSRLPRKMLSSWVPHKRLVGAPEFTYGRGLMKSIRRLSLDKNNWSAAASDKTSWRKLCTTIRWYYFFYSCLICALWSHGFMTWARAPLNWARIYVCVYVLMNVKSLLDGVGNFHFVQYGIYNIIPANMAFISADLY